MDTTTTSTTILTPSLTHTFTTSTNDTNTWTPHAPELIMTAQVVMFVAIAAVNVLTLVVMALTPRLQTIPNMYIAALAVSDLVVSFNQLMAIPWTSPDHHHHFQENAALCMFFKCLLHVNELTSLFIIAAIGMDRYLYIQHPFWYLRIVTKRKVKVIVVVVWALSLLIALPIRFSDAPNKYPGCDPYALLYDSETAGYFNGVLFFAICFVLFVSYGIVIRSALKQARAIQSLLPRVLPPPPSSPLPRPSSPSSASITNNHSQAHPSPPPSSVPAPLRVHEDKLEASLSLKIVQKMAGVFLMLFVCWTPYVLIGLIGPRRVGAQLVLMSGFLAAFNSAANFGVYALGDREFRAATCRILRCGKSEGGGGASVSTRPSSLTTLTAADQGVKGGCCRTVVVGGEVISSGGKKTSNTRV